MRPKPITFLFALGFAGVGLFAASKIAFPSRVAAQSPQPSPLLERVQALGDLHAVKYTYRDVHSYETNREPEDYLAALPGADSVVRAATRNEALMSYTGTVEAGVDLTKAKIRHQLTGIEIDLPAPTVYPANVSAKVEDLKRGLFWRDISIATTAIEDAKQRFRETSLKQGILVQTKQNVRHRLNTLVRGLTQEPVRIVFQGEKPSARLG